MTGSAPGTGSGTTAAAARAAFRAFPVVPLSDLLRGAHPLVLSPHPDDESLGCGGLIALCAAAGTPCSVAMLTDGGGSHPGSATWPPTRLAAAREAETRAALSVLGHPAERLRFHRFPDAALPAAGPGFERAVAAVIAQAAEHGCGLLVASWIADPHCDHEAAALIAAEAARRARLRLLFFPVWGWCLPDDAPVPQVPGGRRLDVSAVRDAKRRAVAAHRTQHGAVVTDDPGAFVLPAELLAACDQPFEVFLDTPPA